MISIHQKITKRLVDVFISLMVLALFMPLFAIISFLISLSSHGPILFRQQRSGKNGKPFTILKFRTMYIGSPDLRNPDGSCYISPNDTRLTKIGRFLREWSLDELPEFINILLGDMSLVGPRPDQAKDISLYNGRDRIKLRMKPGITSLAMINGRNNIPWRKRMEWEIKYVENYSLKLDILILFHTIKVVLMREGVYTS